ncbi:MAG: YlxR family protein [Acidimicrobiia bacterium]|nr:YlxR family protein [Acidimicrobiia bacterium]
MAERTCIGCGRKAPRDALIRIVRLTAAERAALDPARSAAGRGAWLCPSVDCFDVAAKRRAFDRALRTELGGAEIARLRDEFGERVLTRQV